MSVLGLFESFCARIVSRCGLSQPSIARFSSLTLLLLIFDGSFLLAQRTTRIEYEIDARQSSKGHLIIKAIIHGLPKGDVSFRFSDSSRQSQAFSKRIGPITCKTDRGVKRIDASDDRFAFTNESVEPIELKYSLKSGSFSDLLRTTYINQARCFLHSHDGLLNFEDVDTLAHLSFLLPAQWKVITPAKTLGNNIYEILPGEDYLFYLGVGTEIRQNVLKLPTHLIIDPLWPVSEEEILEEVQKQVRYLQESSSNPFQSLFTVLMSQDDDRKSGQVHSFRNGNWIVVSAPQDGFAETVARRKVTCKLAETLAGVYLPRSDRTDDSEFAKVFREYLAWKIVLKTGSVSRGEFLERMADGFLPAANKYPLGFRELAGETEEENSDYSILESGGVLAFFLIDLALGFHGKESNSIEMLLQRSFKDFQDSDQAETLFLRELQFEKEASQISDLLRSSEPPEINEILRPYGLVLEKKELPSFGFELSESFQITRLHTEKEFKAKSELQVGDRILAIDERQMMQPMDLLKWRSSTSSGREVVLTIERYGNLFKVRHVLDKKIHLRLEANPLADSDKKQKLERLLERAISS